VDDCFFFTARGNSLLVNAKSWNKEKCMRLKHLAVVDAVTPQEGEGEKRQHRSRQDQR
jgi:hypothetical protein